jgi:DNA-binding IclR family transcriptional regulator
METTDPNNTDPVRFEHDEDVTALPQRTGNGVRGTGLITKAWDVLDAVGEAPGRLGIAELAQRIGLPKSTLYRIVAALSARGLVRTDPRAQTLSLGFHFLDLANKVWSVPDLAAVASVELRRLREMTGETAYLAALSDEDAVAIARNVGAHENSSMSALGTRKPLYCTSQGKAILAHLPQKQAEHLISGITFQALTEHTIMNADRLRRHLEVVRHRGYAIDDQEFWVGTRCVGAPIFDAAHVCVGSISMTGPAYRMTLDRVEQLGPELIEAARRIQSSLPPPQPFDDPRGHGCRAIGEKSFHSIAPCWSEKDQRLYWADRLAPAVYGLDDLGEPRLIAKTPQPISAIGIAPEGGVDVVCEESWLRVEPLSEAVRAVGAAPRGLSTIRVGEDGARWGAVVGDGKSEIGLLDPEGGLQVRWSVSAEISDLAVTGGGLVYGADGARGLVYEFESRRSAPRVLARIALGWVERRENRRKRRNRPYSRAPGPEADGIGVRRRGLECALCHERTSGTLPRRARERAFVGLPASFCELAVAERARQKSLVSDGRGPGKDSSQYVRRHAADSSVTVLVSLTRTGDEPILRLQRKRSVAPQQAAKGCRTSLSL